MRDRTESEVVDNEVVETSALQGADETPAVVPKTRQRVSGVELEGRFDAWTERRQERRDAIDHSARRRRGAAITMAAATLGLVATMGLLGDQNNGQAATNAAQIVQLESKLADLGSTQVQQEQQLTAEQLESLTGAAARDATLVAQGQQRFAELYHEATALESVAEEPHVEGESEEEPHEHGGSNEAMLQIAEQRRALASHFDPRTFLISDENAYSWLSQEFFDADTEIDPRYPWFIAYDAQYQGLEATAYTWSLQTVMPDLGEDRQSLEADQVRVIWVNTDAAGAVLAWASATYVWDSESESGLFEDLEVVVTGAGVPLLGTVPISGSGEWA